MLHGIHPILTGDLIAALDRLGHGEELVVADANFPAYRFGAPVIETPGQPAPAVVEAIRTVLPLDRDEEESVLLMAGRDPGRLPVQDEIVAAASAPDDRVLGLERFAFYGRAGAARLVVRTGELRPYGNVILRTGVVNAYRSRGAAT